MKRIILLSFFLAVTITAMVSCADKKQEIPVEENKHATHTTAAKEEGALIIQAQSQPDTLKGSLKAEAHGQIGNAHLTINYHSPAVRGRTIWGGLVAYDQVWVTGAHSATSLTTDKDITIGGELLPAGRYALFTIPGKEEWTVVVNRNWEQHLADDYTASDDVLRIKVKPQAADQHQERLRYEIVSEKENEGSMVISWEKMKVAVPVEVEN
ncbi:DUF2911 domain-containing protein [Pontibacter sp. BT310]|uniref:DUF2911 domain-containing protein n=2 Tax=Pontibacter TaxID=323449 RepID=A0ABS6XGC3_9BACT|nr:MULTISPECIES: DUF2911 domain-containing protein [Pontibacter]MBJ6120088.1 DUF2911 domain-containing protein [Pontibacter sp. BT310]MBR0572519.1 DUF2911 domain-containing protein [Microvirga sp. STS03]MBW3366941.1 DUF2911 domain-containing protein [Pontibacter populi]